MDFSSDCDSVRTEDFAMKFCQYVTSETCKDNGFLFETSEKGATPTQKNEKFSDNIMRMRPCQEDSQVRNEARFSPTKQIFNQALDLDSVATEIFDDQMNNFQDSRLMSGRSAPTDSCNTSLHLGNLSNVLPIRRDIMNKFLSKYSLEEDRLAVETRNPSIDHNQIKKRISNENEKPSISKKEVNWKNEYNKSPPSKFHSNGDLASDIRKKSIRIQNEIHEERKRKLDSIHEMNVLREQTPREQLDIKVQELDQLTNRMQKARADREKIADEMNSLRSNLRHKSLELKSDQRWKDGKKLQNESGSQEVILSKQQMQLSQNKLHTLNSQLNQKKLDLLELEDRIRQRLLEIQDLESIGLSKQEIRQVIDERNELYEILRQSEENGNDRYELQKKLTEVTEDFSLEHKKSREKIMKLEEELDSCFKKIRELHDERERLSKDLLFSKETMQKQQDDTNEIYMERNDLRRQLDKYKEELDSERCSSREMVEQERKRFESHLATEEAQTKIIIADLKSQLSSLQFENSSNAERTLSYKSRIAQLENECLKMKSELEQQENDFRERTEKMIDEKNYAVEKLKKEFYSKKENEIQTLKIEFSSEQERTINNLKDCYKQQNSDLQMRLENKCQEVQDLKSDIRKMKQDFTERENDLKGHCDLEISRIKDDLRKNIDSFEKQKCTEADDMKIKYEALLKKINREIEEERGMNEKLRASLEKANKDIAQESELAKKYKGEKIAAITKLKESAKEKLQEEYKNLKEFYEKELEDQLKVVEQTMQEKNSQIITKSREIKYLQTANMEIKSTFTCTLSYFFDAIRHQCSQMANEGKFVPPSFKNIKLMEDVDMQEVVQTIIRNFQICCQEYSQYYHEVIEKLKEEKDESLKMIEEKSSRDMQAIKEQILKDHADELNTLNVHHKQELSAIQRTHYEEIERLRQNVKDWKQKTADRLAQKLEKEFHKEMERKSNKREANGSSSLSLHSFKNEISPISMKPIGLIEDLRANIRQLRDDNLALRKVISGQNSMQNEESKDDNRGHNGSLSGSMVNARPQSVGHDSYRQRRNSNDDHISRSGSYRLQKQ